MNLSHTDNKKSPNVLEFFIKCKDGHSPLCGDAIAVSENYIAVIDGATPKDARTWDGVRGDIFVAGLLKNAVLRLPSDLTAAAMRFWRIFAYSASKSHAWNPLTPSTTADARRSCRFSKST